MGRVFHFIAGLPRSGSTLLSAILQQNPNFHAHMSGPLSPIFNNLLASMGPRSEFYSIIPDERRGAVLQGVFENFYADLAPGRVVFDTNRMWTSKLSSLAQLHPNAKIICCVRPIPQIINSLESIARKSPFLISRIFNCNPNSNIYTRVEIINGAQGAIGLPYGALKEAFYGPYADRLVVVPYDALVSHTSKVFAEIYRAIGEPFFEHDFENFEMEVDAFDKHIGMAGLHQVKGPIKMNRSPLLIPPDIIRRFQHSHFWADSASNPRETKVLAFAEAGEQTGTAAIALANG